MSESVNLGQARALRQTDKALLVQLDSEDEPRWVPQSQIHDDSDVYDADRNATGLLIVTKWWADKAGLT